MARVYKRTDRIPVKIDDVILKLSPLSFDQKMEIMQLLIEGKTKGDFPKATRGVMLSLKYSIKGIEGLTDSDNQPYKLEFENAESLTDDCVSELLNLSINMKLSQVCAGLVNGIKDTLTDHEGNILEGVELLNRSEEKND